MHITLGLGRLDTAQKIKDYYANGVREYFVGYVPRSWLNKYGWEVCPNRRNSGPVFNFANVADLRDMVEEIHNYGCTLNFAVNAHDNGVERMDDIKEMIDIFEPMNPDSYIIADPAILFCLEKWGIKRPIHLSTGIGCFNQESVRFWCERFNVTRVILPRKMTLRESKALIDSLADLHLEFEVLVMGYRCYFNDEDCHSVHSGNGNSLCQEVIFERHTVMNRLPDNWKDVGEFMGTATEKEMLTEGSMIDKYRKELFKDLPPKYPDFTIRSSGVGLDSVLTTTCFQNCGLCAIKALREMGVEVLKVPLRGVSESKLRAVEMVNKVMTAENPDREFCRKIINSPDYCNNGMSCYYEVEEDK